ncbi:hypothetical protein M9H77_16162 [Catharanthus roseus]|uniref:Uncharacterized protein n=1 Tax=Catharanthus roseus TaxID=4058 RepID=A0ACC0AZI9_CATRO|nr:hypothetical protein M9H77_16162 [Catharanthus roseus]
MYFPMFAPAVRRGTQSCYKSEHKLLDIRLRLDMMTTSGDSGLLGIHMARLYCAMYSRTPYPTYGGTQARKQQDVRGEELICGTLTSVLAIPPSTCTDDYMQWFLLHSHPRIQNPLNIPRGFHVPIDPLMPPQALLDLVAHETR